ncbi:MAG: Gfo/Idh/MocA family oxidoreductase [Cyanobacteria bacterium P01_A01_bin.84]
MYDISSHMQKGKVRLGIIGTGYAAKHRAEYFLKDERSELIAVSVGYSELQPYREIPESPMALLSMPPEPNIISGEKIERLKNFANRYNCIAEEKWQNLVTREDIDLIVIASANYNHGAIAFAALSNNKHVIVEYPLCLDLVQAEEIINLAKSKNKFLHVEHIEVLGSLHKTIKQYLPQIGNIFYTRYSTIKPQDFAPKKWTYHHNFFGFPFMGALSRIHRLTDLFGKVVSVNSHQRYWLNQEPVKENNYQNNYYQSCLCSAQICFNNGILAELIYGKGETLWQKERKFAIHGENGGLFFDGDKGFLITNQGKQVIELSPRKGLFAQDSKMVLDHLFNNVPLYITPEASLYALKIADAARVSAETGMTQIINNYV